MYRLLYLAVVFFISGEVCAQTIPPIGQWREHIPWNNATQVALIGNNIVAATPYALFFYDLKDGSFTRRSKVNGLSDINTSAMGVDPVSGKTVL